MLSLKTAVFMIDDIHFLDAPARATATIANHLKFLANTFPVTLIYIGVGVRERGILTEGLSPDQTLHAQFGRRTTALSLRPFQINTEEGRLEWRRRLLTIEHKLVRAEKYPGMLADDLSDYLLARSSGHFASLMALINRGCPRAIRTRHQRLDTWLMDQVNNDAAAEEARRELACALEAGLLTIPPPGPPTQIECVMAWTGGSLPVSLRPLPGEALESWIGAYARRLHATSSAFLDSIGLTGARTTQMAERLTEADADALHHATGVPRPVLTAMTLSPCGGLAVTIHPDPRRLTRPSAWRFNGARTRYCPACLAENAGRGPVFWRMPWAFACPTHRSAYVFSLKASAPLRRGASSAHAAADFHHFAEARDSRVSASPSPPLSRKAFPVAKQVQFDAIGGPEVLILRKVPTPVPGAGEVLIRVDAIGLNRAEIMYREGRYFYQPSFPSTLGYEAAGAVEAVGEDVTGFAAGDSVGVVPAFLQTDYGTYGDLVLVPASSVVPRPTGIDPIKASAVWMAYLTAYGALAENGFVRPGDHVLITAASSSVGLAAIQTAHRIGAIPIATTRRADKKQALLDAGATHVIVTDDEDLPARIKEITGGEGVRLAFDPIAGPGVNTIAQGIAPGGSLVVYGALDPRPTPLPNAQSFPALTTRTYTLFEITTDAERLRRGVAFVNAGLSDGSFDPVIDRVFDLSDIVEAHRHMASNTQIGKIVVTVRHEA
ncbi:TniQ family protein [Streptomyces adustus]